MPEKLVYLNPTEPFNLYLKIGALAGLFVASPSFCFRFGYSFLQASIAKRSGTFSRLCSSTVALFLAGGYFGYQAGLSPALDFLIGYGKQFQPMITTRRIHRPVPGHHPLGMAMIFELPILVFFLSLMGIVTAGWMWRNLRYSILRYLHHRSHPHTDDRHPEHVHLRRAHGRAFYILSIGIAYLVHPAQRRSRRDRS